LAKLDEKMFDIRTVLGEGWDGGLKSLMIEIEEEQMSSETAEH
jgi:hypothetical protein